MSVLFESEEAQQSFVGRNRLVTDERRNERWAARIEPAQRDPRGLFRSAVLRRLTRLKVGCLCIVESGFRQTFGGTSEAAGGVRLRVTDSRFYRMVALGGGIGAAEAYIRGYWQADDLLEVMRILARNADVLTGVERGTARLLRPVRAAANWFRRNTRDGSKRNIAAHYDLSNEFFALMLDSTMTYSSGVFPSPTATLEEASIEKYDRICRKLQLTPFDHVLEIGTGWGGFACHAARKYGCRVTTTTISRQQHDFAEARIQKEGLQDRISLRQDDYRDLDGKYDKLVSIEMIEAVGARFLPGYFAKCSELLKDDGMMALQAITIPDQRYDRYRRSVDFIQQYIFPGGFLPSVGAMAQAVGRRTDLDFCHIEDFGCHYADTLALWRENFWNRIEDVRRLGFDDRFIRTWHYYLCYCEAGFRERQIGVSQLLLTKPACRRQPLLGAV